MQPTVTGVRHIKVFVTDLARSSEWYTRVFGLVPDVSFEDSDGVVRGRQYSLPGTSLKLALREHPDWVRYDCDPFALATSREALDIWDEHLGALGVLRTPVLRASGGWALGFRDPDGTQIRLYAEDDAVSAGRGAVIPAAPPVDPATLLR